MACSSQTAESDTRISTEKEKTAEMERRGDLEKHVGEAYDNKEAYNRSNNIQKTWSSQWGKGKLNFRGEIPGDNQDARTGSRIQSKRSNSNNRMRNR